MGGAEGDAAPPGGQAVDRSRSRGPASSCTGRSSCTISGPTLPGRCSAMNASRRAPGDPVGLEAPAPGGRRLAADILGGLRARPRRRSGSRRTRARPSRSRPGSARARTVGRVGAGVVGHLFAGDRQGQPPAERGQQIVRPGVGSQDDGAGPERARSLRLDLDRPVPSRRPVTGGPLEEPSRRTPRASRWWAAFARFGSARPPSAWKIVVGVVGQPPLRPAADRLGRVEQLERDRLGGQALA